MTRALVVAASGLVLLAAGLAASPWPWTALAVPGVFLVAVALVVMFRMEVDA
jgi:hypothetical protein